MQVTIHKLSVDVYPFFPAGKYITPRRSLSDSVTEINTKSDFHSWQGIGWWEQIYAVNLNSWIKLLYENKKSDYDSYVIFVDQSKI